MHTMSCHCPNCRTGGRAEFEMPPFAFEDEAQAWEDELRRGPAAARPARPAPRRRPRPPFRRPRRPAIGFGPAPGPCVCPVHGTDFAQCAQTALEPASEPPASEPFPSEPATDAGEVYEFEMLELESPSAMPTLRVGSRGATVTDLQRRLATAGFSPGKIDGIFGSQTAAAVRAFQSARRLKVDAIVGPQTWGALLGTAPVAPGGGGTASNQWVLPAAVRAAGDAQYVRYDSPPPWSVNPSSCSGTFTPGAATLKAYIEATFAGVTFIGGYDCRQNSASPSQTSVHGAGRALDIMIDPIGGKADGAAGDPIANWLVRNAQAIGVQFIIWNHMKWNASFASGSKFAPYTPENKHIDHIHVEINNDGAARRTPWFRGR
jgi:hypothetical protein